MKPQAAASLVAAVLLAGCEKAPLLPRSLRSAYDFAYQAVSGRASSTRCWTKSKLPDGSWVLDMDEPRSCYFYSPPRRMQGVYIDEFEGQRFLENASTTPPLVARDDVWFDVDQQSDLRRTPRLRNRENGTIIWLVDFIGRRTESARGGYGHMGGSNADVLVDRMISAQPIASFPGYLPAGIVREPINSDNRR